MSSQTITGAAVGGADPRPAAVTFVTAEHFTLQGARAATIAESTGRATMFRERDILMAGEPRQPAPQVRPVSRADLAAGHLPGHGVDVVEGDLLPVDIQPAYDGHRDLLKLGRGRTPLHANCLRGQS